MKTRSLLRSSLLLCACSLVAALALAQSRPDETAAAQSVIEKAVLETNAKMLQAGNSLDAEGFFAHILNSDKCVIIQNGSAFKTRQEALDTVKAGFKRMQKMDRRFDNPQVTVISPDTALLTSEGTMAATLLDGRVINARFAVSLLFVRKGADWKVLHGHYSTPLANQ